MIKKTLFSILFLTSVSKFCSLQAQVLTVLQGTNLVIKPGTAFSADSIVLTPSAEFILNGTSLGKNTTVNHQTSNAYIARVYQFSGATSSFTGTIQFYYQDGAELNGLAESGLQLNINNGTSWQAFTSTTNDVNNNFVLTTSISGIQLDELTLASALNSLPLKWRSFTATRQQENVLLEWSTFSEQNTKLFIVQYSTNGTLWKTINTVSAAGNISSVNNYTYLHITPAQGTNYYRIAEADVDNKYNYSIIRNVLFTSRSLQVSVLGNPVTTGMLQIKVSMADLNDLPPLIQLYSADGKLIWVEQLGNGIHTINVSNYPKGTYLLKANEKIIKFLIQ